jgi:signal transduction histidine kinase
MNVNDWPWMKGLSRLLATRRPEPLQQARRIVEMQLHIVLPAKAGVIGVMFYYLFHAVAPYEVTNTRGVAVETLQKYFLLYVLCNAVAGIIFLCWRRFAPGLFQWLLFTLGLLDGVFMAGLTFVTGGFESMGYWMFPGLIVLNAISIPLATPQIVLNLSLSVFYLSAGILNAKIPYESTLEVVPRRNPSRLATGTNLPGSMAPPTNPAGLTPLPESATRVHRRIIRWDNSEPRTPVEDIPTEPFLLRVSVLLLLTVCCYGVQVLEERQRRTSEEEREFAVREAQLRTAGRVAAQIAHQLKNPLAIINNTVFSLQRAWKENKLHPEGPIQMIQEEIGRADRILTDLMGYAQLAEGRVERLEVIPELEQALEQVFPPAAGYGTRIERHFGSHFPPLLMQRRHLSEILVNLLLNAREVLHGAGTITITAVCRPDYATEITIADDGPGIAPDRLERIFEAYYSTKEKGTGLGLAIVKHNIELYAGSVRAESELGKGARFVLVLPAKAVINLAQPI